jgi:uncharacterized RDD family membrane protein YckC
MPKKEVLPANFWKRLIAFILDLLVIYIIVVMPFGSFFQSMMQPVDLNEAYKLAAENAESMAYLFFVVGCLALLYFVLMEWKLGQTIGKMLVGIKVVTIDGKAPGFWQCVGRSLFVFPFFPFILLWIIDPVSIYLSPKRQRFCEMLTKTMVADE